MKLSLLLSLIIFLNIGKICALSITSIEGKKDRRDFEFSKTMIVRGIELKNGFLKMPLDGYKKKKYSNIKILSKEFYHKILNCFNGETCESSAEKKDILIKVEKIFSLKSPLRVANANISFDEELVVVFGIVKEKEVRGRKQEAKSQRSQTKTTDTDKIWIAYPKDFEIIDGGFKDNLEKLIKKEFKETLKSEEK
ncbi:MAG: hypothetical protein U9Q34_01335 [Elusimicrobiota bacterium]|nr:hypothetical protein [Elusimicrobiota bacterium]